MIARTEYNSFCLDMIGLREARRGDAGFSMVEILVAMALGLLLLGTVVQSYMGSRTVYDMTEGVSRMQENYRYVMSHIARNLDAGGYAGCLENLESNHVNTLDNVTGIYDFVSAPVSGTDGGTGPDTLVVTRALGLIRIPLTGSVDPSPGSFQNVTINNGDINYTQLAQWDVVTVSNCTLAATFMITNDPTTSAGVIQHRTGSSSPGGLANATTDLQSAKDPFGDGITGGSSTAGLYKTTGVSYTINTGGNAVAACNPAVSSTHRYCALFANGNELVEGVHDLQVTYGIPSGTATRYLRADQLSAAATKTIESVRVALSMNTVQPVNGKDVIRKTFTRVFRVRNKAP